jgi:TetR/AcrR family transcriptional regulator
LVNVTNEDKSRQKILDAARSEFAEKGFDGARVEKIAHRAKINKAMIFYYFGSKEGLYREILKQVLGGIFKRISGSFQTELTADEYCEVFPRIYITYFKENPDFIRIIGYHLLRDPEGIKKIVLEILPELSHTKLRKNLFKTLSALYHDGRVSEPDPRQIMMNLIGLSIFTFMGLPMVEAFSGMDIVRDEAFFETRIRSVTNLLKRGMLT